jgi:hypothetical protein
MTSARMGEEKRSGDSDPRRFASVAGAPTRVVGNMIGTPIAAAAQHFDRKYGRAAANDVVARIPDKWRQLVAPNVEAMGILGSRWYPYAFLADWIFTAKTVVHAPDEDAFIRELAWAGIDGSMSTGMRAMARWFGSPRSFAEHSQESWRMFHDTGIVTVPTLNDHEARRRIAEWQGHNVTVCKVVAEVFTRSFSKTGVRTVRCRREECVAWGHAACVFHIEWT